MSAELFAVVGGQRFDLGLEGWERFDDRLAYQERSNRQFTGLLWAVAPRASVAAQSVART